MTRLVASFQRICAIALLASGSVAVGAQGPHPETPPPAAGRATNGPVLGRLRIFDDWAVACDNRLSCSAVSLVPEGAGKNYSVLVSISREGGPQGAGQLQLIAADELRGKIDLVADKRRLARIVARHDMVEMTGPAALDAIRALGSSYTFELRIKDRQIDAPSLFGLPAALRYIDELQGRIGSKGALAAIGDGAADAARPVPGEAAFPVGAPLPADGPPPVLTAQEEAAARKMVTCEARLSTVDYPLETHALDDQRVLVLLPCNAGAYNVSTVPLVASGSAGQRQFQMARFDYLPGLTGEPDAPPLIVNARWNPARGELSSFAKGRGLGDCGTAETYRWDGGLFRLVEARSMPVCRGAWEWPVLYRANASR